MKKQISFFVAIYFTIFNPCFSADIEKIAVVDIDKIIAESEVMKDIKKQVEERKKKMHDEITKESDQFEKEKTELEKSETKLSPEAFDQKIKNHNNKINEAKHKMQSKRINLEEAYEDTMLHINEVAQEIIAEYSKKNKIDLVLPTSQILYSKEMMNITEDIAKKLNEKIKKIALKKESEK